MNQSRAPRMNKLWNACMLVVRALWWPVIILLHLILFIQEEIVKEINHYKELGEFPNEWIPGDI